MHGLSAIDSPTRMQDVVRINVRHELHRTSLACGALSRISSPSLLPSYRPPPRSLGFYDTAAGSRKIGMLTSISTSKVYIPPFLCYGAAACLVPYLIPNLTPPHPHLTEICFDPPLACFMTSHFSPLSPRNCTRKILFLVPCHVEPYVKSCPSAGMRAC